MERRIVIKAIFLRMHLEVFMFSCERIQSREEIIEIIFINDSFGSNIRILIPSLFYMSFRFSFPRFSINSC